MFENWVRINKKWENVFQANQRIISSIIEPTGGKIFNFFQVQIFLKI